MEADRVYLDTSFFTGLLEDQESLKDKYTKILRWERSKKSEFFTSQLTINEFLVPHYDKYKNAPDCEERAQTVVNSLCAIATTYSFSDAVCRKAARYLSVWGQMHRHDPNLGPRSKNFRWDAIHLATADTIGVDRLYARDGPWNSFPKAEIPRIKRIVCPPELIEPELFNGPV